MTDTVPEPTPEPLADPVPPFEATLAGVQALLPTAKLVDELGFGQQAVTKADALSWLHELSATLELRLDGWTGLSDDRRDQVQRMARDAVQNGAASYVQAARFPEQSDKTSDSYAAVLWARYQRVADALVVKVGEWLNDTRPTTGGARISAPPASIPDCLGF